MTTSSSINISVVRDSTFSRKEISFFHDIRQPYEENFAVDFPDF
ncbi:MAG: hypothetical protein RSB82_01385 [Victivallaceae bacterium]